MESKGLAEGIGGDATGTEVNTAPPATSSALLHQGVILCFTQWKESRFCFQTQADKPFTENRSMAVVLFRESFTIFREPSLS